MMVVNPLIAEGLSRVVSFSERVRRGASARFDWEFIAGVTLGLAIAAAVAFWLTHLGLAYVERRRHSPLRLFHELCHAHGLNRMEVQVLLQLARTRQLAQPAAVFLDPNHLDARRLHGSLKPQAAEVAALRQRLFAEPN
jgi:hypothetical protein